MAKVISIIGYTRSGSTLLDSILGQIDGFFSTGELHYLWQRGLLEARRCGCGRPVPGCPVWTRILRTAFDDDIPDPKDVIRWQEGSVRTRHTFALLRDRPSWPIDRRALERYRPVATATYRAIATATGARVIVDSSKRPSDGALLLSIPEVDAYFVHLVRDPRGIAFSWARQKRELDTERPSTMPRQGPLESTVGWLELNIAAEAVRRAVGRDRSMLVRYEDFMAAPMSTIEAIVRLVGERPDALPFEDETTAMLGPNHTVAGNPGRFSQGAIALRPDVEWRSRMPRRDRYLATLVAGPLLGRYGYPVSVP